ncbi:hypothetical protein B0A55_13476, partial [Friedmanniomyces simplex]
AETLEKLAAPLYRGADGGGHSGVDSTTRRYDTLLALPDHIPQEIVDIGLILLFFAVAGLHIDSALSRPRHCILFNAPAVIYNDSLKLWKVEEMLNVFRADSGARESDRLQLRKPYYELAKSDVPQVPLGPVASKREVAKPLKPIVCEESRKAMILKGGAAEFKGVELRHLL